MTPPNSEKVFVMASKVLNTFSSFVCSMVIMDIFRPTPLKLFFPILIFILLIISFVVNSLYLPAAGTSMCTFLTNTNELITFSSTSEKIIYQENSDPEEVLSTLKQQSDLRNQMISSLPLRQSSLHANALVLGNLYLIASKIYKLNPLFPTPCEAVSLDQFTNPSSCEYYISEENYNCIYDSTQSQTPSPTRPFDLQPYQKISFLFFLVHSVILVVITYVLISLLSSVMMQLLGAPLLVRIIVKSILLFIPMFLFLIFDNLFILLLIPLIALFFIYSFIQQENYKTLFLHTIVVIFILLFIAGLFVANYVLEKRISETFNSPSSTSYEYSITACNNTKILTFEEKQRNHIKEEYLDEEWNVCDNPSCSKQCDNYCTTKTKSAIKAIMLRGDNPSCICACK